MTARQPLSIRLRLLLAAATVLILFLSGTGLILDQAFRTSVEDSAEEQLRLRVLSLLGAAEMTNSALTLPGQLAEPRFNQPGAGLYARVIDGEGDEVWASRSLLGRAETLGVPVLPPGTASFDSVGEDVDDALYRYSLGVLWEGPIGDVHYVFAVAMAQAPFLAEAQGFRRAMSTGLGSAALGLLLVQLGVLAVALRPLRRLSQEVERVERGDAERLDGRWPDELQGLARNLNVLIDHERARQERYRTTLDDLAHSLKTPLAILQNAVADAPTSSELAEEQIARMQTMVHHHLQRASVTRNPLRSHRTPLVAPLERLVAGLRRLYADTRIEIARTIEPALAVAVDERDLYEILGNLAENACKFGRSRVQIDVRRAGAQVAVTIADDGPGVPAAQRRALLDRGARGDTTTSGQGIGLAMVSELVASWDGQLRIDTAADLGGASVTVLLPAA